MINGYVEKYRQLSHSKIANNSNGKLASSSMKWWDCFFLCIISLSLLSIITSVLYLCTYMCVDEGSNKSEQQWRRYFSSFILPFVFLAGVSLLLLLLLRLVFSLLICGGCLLFLFIISAFPFVHAHTHTIYISFVFFMFLFFRSVLFF